MRLAIFLFCALLSKVDGIPMTNERIGSATYEFQYANNDSLKNLKLGDLFVLLETSTDSLVPVYKVICLKPGEAVVSISSQKIDVAQEVINANFVDTGSYMIISLYPPNNQSVCRIIGYSSVSEKELSIARKVFKGK
jgi:hypothetical protein